MTILSKKFLRMEVPAASGLVFKPITKSGNQNYGPGLTQQPMTISLGETSRNKTTTHGKGRALLSGLQATPGTSMIVTMQRTSSA